MLFYKGAASLVTGKLGFLDVTADILGEQQWARLVTMVCFSYSLCVALSFLL